MKNHLPLAKVILFTPGNCIIEKQEVGLLKLINSFASVLLLEKRRRPFCGAKQYENRLRNGYDLDFLP